MSPRAPSLLLSIAVLLTACSLRAPDAAFAPLAPSQGGVAEVAEAFVSASTPEDNIDSPAAWTSPDGAVWLLATAKTTDRLVVYDGQTGATLRSIGERGDAPGRFRRPNGIAVIDDLALVVERDNRRVQALRLPDFEPMAVFGSEELHKPYGLWVRRDGDGYQVYVTDAYMAGENAQGEDILPPLEQLDQRIKRYVLEPGDGGWQARLLDMFGDTSEAGALRVVESIWGDPDNDRLLIAEEDEDYANELKVYTLDGRYSGRTIGAGILEAQAEGVMLKRCGDGGGWWIATAQGKEGSVFHLFERDSLAHVGAFSGAVVANTDGIWLDQRASARFPEGALYAVHDDQGVAAFDWRDIAAALALPACGNP